MLIENTKYFNHNSVFKGEPKDERVFDYTSLSLYLACPMKYKLRTVLNLVPAERAPALAFGGAIHKALASWYTHHNLGGAIAAFKGEYKNSDDTLRTVDKGIQILQGYAEKYKKEPFSIVFTERGYAIPLGRIEGVDTIYAGRLDGVVKWGEAFYVLEHKTTTRLGYSYFEQFTPNLQIDGYAILCRELMGRCDGVLVNAIGFNKVKKTDFIRSIANRTEEDIKRALTNIRLIVLSVLRSEKNGEFYQNKLMCNYYGRCPYKDFCESNFDERVLRIYKHSVWNPLLGREEDEI